MGYTEMIIMGLYGKKIESNSGRTAEHSSQQNAVIRQHLTVSSPEGPEYPAENIRSANKNVFAACTGTQPPGSSSLISGKESVPIHM